MDPIEVSVVIVNYNTRSLLRKCLKSIQNQKIGKIIEIFVVDNASSDGSTEMVMSEFSQVHLIQNDKNVGYSIANNQAIRLSRGRYILLLNSDVELISDIITPLVSFLEKHSQVAVVGPICLNSDGSPGLSYGYFPTVWMYLRDLLSLHVILPPEKRFRYPSMTPDPDLIAPFSVDTVIGASMMVRCAAINSVGLLDEGYFAYSEEVDWCYRFHQAGWQVYFLPEFRVIHHSGKSFEQIGTQRYFHFYSSLYRFFRKHYGIRSAYCLRKVILASCYKRILLSWFPLSDQKERRARAQMSKNILQVHRQIHLKENL